MDTLGDMESVPDWSGLLPELLARIAVFLTLTEDFMAFRGVCTSWRAAATKDRFVSVCKVPLLMLAEKDGTDERELYSLSNHKICTRIPLPEAKGKRWKNLSCPIGVLHHTHMNRRERRENGIKNREERGGPCCLLVWCKTPMGQPNIRRKRCINVGFGWIMTLSLTGEVCLLKPFSAARIELPNINAFPEYKKFKTNPVYLFIEGAVLTANPSETLNFTVLVALFRYCFGFWRNGDEKWSLINPKGIAMVYRKELGKLYTLDFTGHFLIWDPQRTDLTKPQELVKVDNVPTRLHGSLHRYLVESTDGELLMITRNNTARTAYLAKGADQFEVMRVDLVKGECKEIKDLGKDAIFVGNHVAVSVDATEFPSVLKPNCVYFTDDCIVAYIHNENCPKGGGKDMGIYNIEDGSVERFKVESFGRACPPLWIFPSF